MAIAVDAFVTEVLDAYPRCVGIELRRDLDCADQIRGDREAMRQVLVELLNNAVQSLQDPAWTPPAGHHRQCLVSTQFITTHVLITVTDNGPGITRDVLPRIFEPSFTTRASGRGCGLPKVREIVEQHGGTVDVDSRSGTGTTVTVWLPRHRAAAAVERPKAAAA
jgi:two-component system sensor histidine kinase AtoS